MRVKNVRGNSTIGWNPTNPPMRGYISSIGIVAWPQPKVWTQRPAWMESAMTSAARRMFSIWVCSMRSITARVLLSHCFATLLILIRCCLRFVFVELSQNEKKENRRRDQADEHHFGVLGDA